MYFKICLSTLEDDQRYVWLPKHTFIGKWMTASYPNNCEYPLIQTSEPLATMAILGFSPSWAIKVELETTIMEENLKVKINNDWACI